MLRIAIDQLGPQNTVEEVFFVDDGAVIFAMDRSEAPCIMMHLTNLADFLRDGFVTREQIIEDIRQACGGAS